MRTLHRKEQLNVYTPPEQASKSSLFLQTVDVVNDLKKKTISAYKGAEVLLLQENSRPTQQSHKNVIVILRMCASFARESINSKFLQSEAQKLHSSSSKTEKNICFTEERNP